MDAAEPALDVAALQVAYGDLVAVRDVSVRLTPGRITALIGRNGAGKTTLLSGICGLLPSRSGTVALDGRDVTRLPPWRRARHGLAIVQEGKQVFRDLSVHDNLRVGLRARRSRGDTAVLDELYERFPVLAERRGERAGALSGGQQQMLAIATALAARPRVLLVDEPSSGLAPAITDQVFDLLDRLRGEGLAILLVEQLVDELLGGIADDVVVLDRGRVTLRDEAANVTAEAIAESIYSPL